MQCGKIVLIIFTLGEIVMSMEEEPVEWEWDKDRIKGEME